MISTFELCDLPLDEIEQRAAAARAAGHHTLIGGLVARDNDRLFSQRRALTRKFLPGIWDDVGGGVEQGETLAQALTREVSEETGWRLSKIYRCVAIRNWQDDHGPSTEYIVTCQVNGDLDHPVLEDGKVDQTAWIGPDNLNLLNENRSGDTSQSQIYAHALKYTHV